MSRTYPLRAFLRGHFRLCIAAVLGALAGFLLPANLGELFRMIAGWDAAALVYLVACWIMMARADQDRIRWRAGLNDEPEWLFLIVTVGSSVVSLLATIGLLANFKSLPDAQHLPHLALELTTILGSWFFLHTIFTMHYAHEYYRAPRGADARSSGSGKNDTPRDRGGLDFPGEPDRPTYPDFLYFAFTIGMTFQTSDVQVISGTLRRMTLAHAILSFFFNTVIVAFTVNIAASLL